MRIFPLLEGTYNVSKTKEFTLLTNDISINEGINMNVCPFLIEIDDELILIDCGIGTEKNDKTHLISKLNSYGFSEKDITTILISHLHKDHITGLGKLINNKFSCYFPNAKIYIQKNELDYALKQDNYSYDINFINALKDYENIIYLTSNKGTINNNITFEVVGGHVPFQQVFWIEEDCQIVFFGADNLPQLSYFKYHAAFKNDVDGIKAMNDRKKWEEEAIKNNWTILFYHGKNTLMHTF